MSSFNVDAIISFSRSISSNREKAVELIISCAGKCEDTFRLLSREAYNATVVLKGADKNTVALYNSLSSFTDEALDAVGFSSCPDDQRLTVAKKLIRIAQALQLVQKYFTIQLHSEEAEQ